MKCPVCGKEMCTGFIRSNSLYVPFIFDGKTDFPVNAQTKINPLVSFGPFIPLSKFSIFVAPKSKGYYCDNCQMVIVNIKENIDLDKTLKNDDKSFYF